jgi:lipopolysaccharide export system permease protein
MKSPAHPLSRYAIPLALAVLGGIICALLMPGEIQAIQRQIQGFPESDIAAHQARLPILQALCFLPAVAGFLYTLGGTLDRYVARQFCAIFTISLSALVAIWLLMDLSDKLGDFRETRHVFQTIGTFYLTRAPAILMLLLPYSLLLSLLYTMGKFSGSREVIAMIQAGRSIVRITLPLILAGGLLSLLCLGLNYQWAPTAEGRQDDILAKAAGKMATEAANVIYLNPSDRRLWRIGVFPQNYEKGAPLLDVEITTTRPDKSLESRLTASSASWNREQGQWTFENSLMGVYPADEAPVFTPSTEPLIMRSWSETPSQLIKPGLSAGLLGIPDLNSWLLENTRHHLFSDPSPYLTQWHYRWALPFTCLVTVLLATPLGVHFSRRGSASGVFLAVVLSALMLLFTSISLALGESGSLRPIYAAWIPNVAFTLLGLYLFRRRISGQPIYHLIRRCFPGNS